MAFYEFYAVSFMNFDRQTEKEYLFFSCLGEIRKAFSKQSRKIKLTIMGFYGKQPVTPEKCSAVYIWTGLGTPGFFSVYVEGEAQNYSYGFDLVRDLHFVGGLKVNSMGWTGPLGKGTTPYKDSGSFQGVYRSEIIVSGSNGDFRIPVREIPHDQVEEYIKSRELEKV